MPETEEEAEAEKQEPSPPWTDAENEAIVADYLNMFQEHVAGDRVRKSEHRRRLMNNGVSRSKGSIEYKHQNISAVLAGMGYPYLPGYHPAWNYQRPLLEMVERFKGKDAFLASAEKALRLGMSLDRRPVNLGKVFVDKPSTEPRQKEARDGLRKILRKIDPATRDLRLREIGDGGEEFVLEIERARMIQFNRSDLIEDVCRVSLRDDSLGYDIRSFDERGEERFIEVKTTSGAVSTPFFITANELEVSRTQKAWVLYRVHQFQNERRILPIAPPLEDKADLQEALWKARLKDFAAAQA